jgi:hypothetical protein
MKWLLFLILLMVAVPVAAGTDLYVSPLGNDSWSGRSAAPNRKNSDGPFATLERARDAIRALKRDGKSSGSITVWLRGGDYYQDQSFELTADDSGTASMPIVYRAYKDEAVHIIGGKPLTNWQPVSDSAILDRLDANARSHVRQLDLKSLGIMDYGVLSRRGFVGGNTPPPMELFFDNRPMTLARWPNETWTRIISVPNGQDGGQFTYEGDRPSHWKSLDDVWVYGYWTYDWADSFEKVATIDTAKQLITTVPPHGVYGYTVGKRFYFLNILEELDSPGEYYIDRTQGKLYFWPPSDTSAASYVSVLSQPLISLTGASFIMFRGLTLEGCRGNAITISGGSHNLIAGCVLRNIGQVAITIGGGATESGVQSCEISATGDGGISLEGGDRKTLISGHLFAVNNHIHHTGRLRRTYTPAISPNGVGCHIAHNLIHDLPHTAIQGGGNDHLIEYNEIYRVCQETGDAGAFYMGRDFTQRGNVVQYNYFHDLRSGALPGQAGFTDVMAVYLDDCFSGVTVFGNLFVRSGRSAMIGGGRDNTIENNIFIDGSPAIHVDSRGKGWAAKYFVDNGEWHIFETLLACNPTQPPYSTRYPQLVHLRTDDPALAKGNRILRNISVGGTWLEMQDGLTDKIVAFKDNYVGNDPGFVNLSAGDYRLSPDSPVWKLGFKPIPYSKIGLQKDEFRNGVPSQLKDQ